MQPRDPGDVGDRRLRRARQQRRHGRARLARAARRGAASTTAALGAACPKILLAGRFVDIRSAAPTHEPGPRRPRASSACGSAGCAVAGPRRVATGAARRWVLGPGAGARRRARRTWTAGEALVRVPVPDGDGPRRRRSSSASSAGEPGPVTVTVESGGERARSTSTASPAGSMCRSRARRSTSSTTSGSMLVADGYGADRGYIEPDDGQYDEPTTCSRGAAAAVLLSSRYLDDVGLLRRAPVPLLRGSRALVARARPRVAVPLRAGLGRAAPALGDERRGLAPRSSYYNERNHLLVLTPPRLDSDSCAIARALLAGHRLVRPARRRQPAAPR